MLKKNLKERDTHCPSVLHSVLSVLFKERSNNTETTKIQDTTETTSGWNSEFTQRGVHDSGVLFTTHPEQYVFSLWQEAVLYLEVTKDQGKNELTKKKKNHFILQVIYERHHMKEKAFTAMKTYTKSLRFSQSTQNY